MEYVQRSRGLDSSSAGTLSRELRSQLMETDDFKEGYLAFKEKREPRWPSMPNGFYNYPAANGRSNQRTEEELGAGE
jgi:hypothetical protein